jgi:hypothetical protein
MSGYVLELRNAIKKATPLLRNIGDEASRLPRRPGKWAPREVIGHLIDSGSNNSWLTTSDTLSTISTRW